MGWWPKLEVPPPLLKTRYPRRLVPNYFVDRKKSMNIEATRGGGILFIANTGGGNCRGEEPQRIPADGKLYAKVAILASGNLIFWKRTLTVVDKERAL